MLAPLITRGFFMRISPFLDDGQILDCRSDITGPPVFTTQPGTNETTGTAGGVTSTAVLYQQSRTLSITGAKVEGADSLMWQQQVNGTWTDQNRTTADLALTAPPATRQGKWRLVATNAFGQTISREVDVVNAFVFLQPQSAADPALTQNATRIGYTGSDTMGTPANFIALIRRFDAPTVNYMGVENSQGVAAVSNDPVKYPATMNDRNITLTPTATGTASVSVRVAALASTLTINVT